MIKESLENLGKFFRNTSLYNSVYSDFFDSIELAEKENNWFTTNNILYAFKIWGRSLTKRNIDVWLKKYKSINSNAKKILIVMPGNNFKIATSFDIFVTISNAPDILFKDVLYLMFTPASAKTGKLGERKASKFSVFTFTVLFPL